jgi:hypothetical protein
MWCLIIAFGANPVKTVILPCGFYINRICVLASIVDAYYCISLDHYLVAMRHNHTMMYLMFGTFFYNISRCPSALYIYHISLSNANLAFRVSGRSKYQMWAIGVREYCR